MHASGFFFFSNFLGKKGLFISSFNKISRKLFDYLIKIII